MQASLECRRDAGGLVGQALAERLIARGDDVVVPSRGLSAVVVGRGVARGGARRGRQPGGSELLAGQKVPPPGTTSEGFRFEHPELGEALDSRLRK